MPRKLKKKAKKTEPKIGVSEKIKKTKIRVIGIGGGGGTIVSEIASRMPKASFLVANTDRQALKTAGRKVTHFQFGQSLTQGLGTGMNAELGKEAALNEKDKIKKLLEGQDLCIIIACLGGGAGSGAAPIFAKISKSLGNLTYGIFTLPFKFEGEKKMEIARDSLKKVKNYLNVITLIPNERVFQIIDKATPLRQALSIINKSLTESLSGLIETIYQPGLINIDFADLKTILEGRGRLAYLNTVEVPRKEEAIKDLMAKVLNSPLYPYTIRGAKGVLFNIAGEKELSLSEVNQISKTISELVNPEAKIIFGISQSQKYSQTIKTTLLATGCGMKIFPSKKIKRKKIKKKLIKEMPAIKEKKEEQLTKPKRKKRKKPKKESKLPPKPVKMRRRKKVKVEVIKEPEEKMPAEPEVKTKQSETPNLSEERVRKNGLQIKKEAQEIEKEMLEKEKFWETPAFLRKKPGKAQ
jgi:cell division protein FtsZ